MSDYHVHHHVNVLGAPGEDISEVVAEEVFPHVVIGLQSETQKVDNPDGSTTFVYTESRIPVAKAKEIAEKHPNMPIVLLSHGHDDTYEERTALVIHGENARFEITSVVSGPVDNIIEEAFKEADFKLGQEGSEG